MAQGIEEIGLSRDLIIHPGETIAEVIEERGMSQRELAIRTGMTEKHISTVISGQKNISPLFARRLEYALGIDASFWMNLQNNYDEEILSYEEIHAISDEEFTLSLSEAMGTLQQFFDSNHVLEEALLTQLQEIHYV